MWPLNLLGSSPGASFVGKLAVSNIQNFAAEQHAGLSVQGNTAIVTLPSSPGSQVAWNYAQSGSTWVPQKVQISPTLPNASTIRTLQFSNFVFSDNLAKDEARASQRSTLQPPPTSNSNVPAAVTPASSTSCDKSDSYVNLLGGVQNISFQHGFNSSACTWTRMVPWLNQDFLFGKELVAKTDTDAGIASQGGSLSSRYRAQVGAVTYWLAIAREAWFPGTPHSISSLRTLVR
jgi:hypothetical protein